MPEKATPIQEEQPLVGWRHTLDLEVHQRALMDDLYKRESSLGAMYHGALSVLADKENPDRLALAAHNIRELLNRLPDHMGVESKDRRIRLSDKVASLAAAWERTCNASSARNGPNHWAGLIDQVLAKFLVEIEEFFNWRAVHIPRRRAVVGKTLGEFDEGSVPLPKPIQDLRISEWENYHNFFVSVAHHSTTSEDDFASNLYWLERYRSARNASIHIIFNTPGPTTGEDYLTSAVAKYCRTDSSLYA